MQILKNSYDLTKVLGVQPDVVERMTVSKLKFYIDSIQTDITDKDPFILPTSIR